MATHIVRWRSRNLLQLDLVLEFFEFGRLIAGASVGMARWLQFRRSWSSVVKISNVLCEPPGLTPSSEQSCSADGLRRHRLGHQHTASCAEWGLPVIVYELHNELKFTAVSQLAQPSDLRSLPNAVDVKPAKRST